ncbi:ORF3 [White sturgeon adenovirus 1]|uniref:ORF3 n=1 Tax=White sturgeon adenovirus 1 TaxID=2580388 RepID=A0A4P8PIY9_9ADEN|nr:ORF3 [White sturgeon adenovirus 1]QCQ84177.1 ORF3 [White sturgeon adenovirus 1]
MANPLTLEALKQKRDQIRREYCCYGNAYCDFFKLFSCACHTEIVPERRHFPCGNYTPFFEHSGAILSKNSGMLENENRPPLYHYLFRHYIELINRSNHTHWVCACKHLPNKTCPLNIQDIFVQLTMYYIMGTNHIPFCSGALQEGCNCMEYLGDVQVCNPLSVDIVHEKSAIRHGVLSSTAFAHVPITTTKSRKRLVNFTKVFINLQRGGGHPLWSYESTFIPVPAKRSKNCSCSFKFYTTLPPINLIPGPIPDSVLQANEVLSSDSEPEQNDE